MSSARSGTRATQKQDLKSPPASPAAPNTPPKMQPDSSSREPEMTALRGGSFTMGSNDDITEKPVHQVTIKPFLISKYPISVRKWNECASAKACALVATGNHHAPGTNIS